MASIKKKQPKMQTFLVPPERHICASVDGLMKGLKGNSVEGADDTLVRVARLVESTAQVDFLSVRRRVIKNFHIFALAAAGQHLPPAMGKGPSPEELDERESVFLEDMYMLLQAAHFRVLGAHEWETAQEENFTFNCPVDVNWQFMDAALLRRFWARHEEERAAAAPISDNILVFVRGISTMRAQGTYINDKIDLLVQYLLIDPFQALYSRITRREARLHIALALNDGTTDQGYLVSDGPPATVDRSSHVGGAAAAEAAPKSGGMGEDADNPSLQHSAAQTVQRQTLRHLMPDARAVFQNLFKTLEIQEPAFKEVVVLYRRKIPDNPVRASEYEPIREHDPALERRNMNMKRFTEIPMADAEIVFPDKRVYLRPLLLIQLSVAIIGALVAGLTLLLSGKLSMEMLLTFVTIMGGRAMQVYTSATFARATVVELITKKMYECTMDAQEGVVTFLLEEMAQQRVKENLLAYALLLLRGQAMSQEELDGACEQYLQQKCGERLDFAIENSLPSLLHDGLIRRDAQWKLQAVPAAEAYDILARKWEHYFEREEEEERARAGQPTASGLSAAGALFGKLCLRPSFPGSFPGFGRASAPKADAAAEAGRAAPPAEPVTTAVDSRAGVITVDSAPKATAAATSSVPQGGAAVARQDEQVGVLAEPFHDAEVDMDGADDGSAAGQGGSGSKRQKLKESFTAFFRNSPKKEQ